MAEICSRHSLEDARAAACRGCPVPQGTPLIRPLSSRQRADSTGRLSLTACFLFTGISVAVWSSRIPDVQHHVQARPVEFGFALLAGAVGALVAMQLSGRLLTRLPTSLFLRGASLAVAATLLGPALADSAFFLAAALFLQGLAHGCMAVAMNTSAVGVERALGRPVMSSFHSAFSIGSLAGALVGAGSIQVGIEPLTLFAVVTIAQLIVLAAMWRDMPPDLAERIETAEDADARASPQQNREARNRLALLGLLAVAAMMCEGSVSDWCGIYLRDQIGGSPQQVPLAFAAYAVAMAVGRLMGDSATVRWGSHQLLRYSAVVSTAGLALTVVASAPWLGIAGFTLFGLGQACVMPQLISLAGKSEGVNTGRAVARVVGLSQIGFLIGPMVMGAIAQGMSLRIAFGLMALLCAFTAVARVPEPSAPKSSAN
ncbi:MFS transporter [Streptomyces sp. NPDC002602]|uniref:MFS transporter n=1 Tax=Streptomyces sp. NPDC002602 TaxID=3364654 RepID=UPI00368B0270